MHSAQITAEFELDERGQPRGTSFGGVNYYTVKLRLQNAPANTYAVTYRLHESFIDPVREARDRERGFAEVVQTYGDFTVQAKVRARDGLQMVARDLVEALRDRYRDGATPAIYEAIEDLSRR